MARPLLVLVDGFPKFSETFVLREVLELERAGVPVQVVSLTKPAEGRFHASLSKLREPVTYLPESPLASPRAFLEPHLRLLRARPRQYLRALLTALGRRRFDALARFVQAGVVGDMAISENVKHLHVHFAASACGVAYYVRLLTGASYSVVPHAVDIFSDHVNRRELVARLNEATFVVAITDYNSRYLRGLGVEAPMHEIRVGFDADELPRLDRRPADPPLVLAIGRLVEKKGFEYLVRACAVMRHQGREFRCVIAGEGPLRDSLEALIARLGLEQEVELRGDTHREELSRLFAAAAVLVAPSVLAGDGDRDGIPTVLVEALALGVPVVSTPVSGIPELVMDGRTGLLVPERDPDSLAAAVLRTLDDPSHAAELAANGRQLVEKDFSARANVARLRSLLEGV